jgi:hypothetical protein
MNRKDEIFKFMMNRITQLEIELRLKFFQRLEVKTLYPNKDFDKVKNNTN